jgi:hypothetical protein
MMVQLRRALQFEVPIGMHGHIDVDQVTYADLDRILADMEMLATEESSTTGGGSYHHYHYQDHEHHALFMEHPDLVIMARTASVVVKIRRAMVDGDWSEVERQIEHCINLVESKKFCPLAVEELQFVESECMNRRAVALLSSTLIGKGEREGQAGQVGEKEKDKDKEEEKEGSSSLSSPSSSSSSDPLTLDDAIADIHDNLSLTSPLVQCVVSLSIVLREVRRQLHAKHWEGVRTALDIISTIPSRDGFSTFSPLDMESDRIHNEEEQQSRVLM